ncbi:hypothetical protein [Novosphingobium colocasiae]|uniref:hypothetical protein n=1 Tax=Novosphingobium colocasiae TaxID=1256513 RepID=UPI0035ADA7AF
MASDDAFSPLVREAIELLAESAGKARALSASRDALLAAHMSNALRSLSLAVHSIVQQEHDPSQYLREILEESDALWSLKEKWEGEINDQ